MICFNIFFLVYMYGQNCKDYDYSNIIPKLGMKQDINGTFPHMF